ncbi:MAG: 50S ribosomal protein L32 [Clostridiales bacterium]|jgi:large subunit ribosomal protein L32|nr:50S ribosomal protein L32 [Clostridiales bacterium]
MAVPKTKTSKQRSNTRYANWKTTAPTLGVCPQCHEPVQAHRVCKACGSYDGEKRIQIKEKKAD